MTSIFKFLACFFVLASVGFSQISQNEISNNAQISEKNDWHIETPPLSYKKAFLYSLLLPGSGHIYTERYVRSGFLIGLEFFLTIDIVNNFIRDKNLSNDIRLLQNQAQTNLNEHLQDTTQTQFLNAYFSNQAESRLLQDNQRNIESLRRSEIGWLVGLHAYGIIDALNIVYQSKNPPPPKVTIKGALLRSLALPGWGQVYNKEFGKAGLLWMAMGNFIASAIFRQQVVNYYEGRRDELEIEPTTSSLAITNSSAFTSQQSIVNSQLIDFRKRRNQFLWGIVILYLYSIGDSIVDAILQDFNQPKSFAITPGSSPFQFNFLTFF